MGGNALNPVKTKRLERKDFVEATERVVRVLNNAIALHAADVMLYAPYEVKAYRKKETFGDLDLLVESTLFTRYTREDMLTDMAVEFKHSGSLPFKKNGDVLSFGVPSGEDGVYFQVDIISTKQEDFLCHASYLNWNDLGNLIGVVASKTKILKHGHDGLYYIFREGTHVKHGEALLTNDYQKTLEFLGYEPSRYLEGFDTLQDVYEYAASSKFFDPVLYSFEERNHDQRMRDRKRPTYNGFLTWIQEMEAQGAFEGRTKNDTAAWMERIYHFFPHFADVEKAKWKEVENKKSVKLYFNADLVREFHPELEGPALGNYIGAVRKLVDNFEEYVLEHKEDAVRKLVELMDKKNPS